MEILYDADILLLIENKLLLFSYSPILLFIAHLNYSEHLCDLCELYLSSLYLMNGVFHDVWNF